MDKVKELLSSLPRKPLVTKCQAVAMATQLFELNVINHSSITEMDGYDDRIFYIQGSLPERVQNLTNGLNSSGYGEYILKVVNQTNTNQEHLIQSQCDVMSFLNAQGHKCSTPIPSTFGTSFVKCKIPRTIPTGHIAETTYSREDRRSGIFEVYNGEENSEEEYFVCAVILLKFVNGKGLNETTLTTQLLFDAGVALGRLDHDLKKLGCLKFDRTGFMWDLATVGEQIEPLLDAIDDKQHVEMVKEVCETFRSEVSPKLHLLPKQIIHGDANYTNILLASGCDASKPQFGFIDFADLHYTCRVFEIAVSLMYIFNIPCDLSCGRSRTAGHFLAGYHSVNPLSDTEFELLPVLVASRFCQLLLIGAFSCKYLCPDNTYVMETSNNGWKNFEMFWKLSKDEVMKTWLEVRQ
ncbi:hydroxylysine kinase-like [Acropora palmata]|uniref:hydroxylysine kinase-like n=1 Tax=Acropora palmata TaxID=6131 RepID=UPI003D9FEF1D